MKDQPLDFNQTASRSEVVSIYKCPTNISGLPQNLGRKTSNFGLPFSTPHISGTKQSIYKQKCKCRSTMCPLQGSLLCVTFDTKAAEIRLLIVTNIRRPLRGNHQSCNISSYICIATKVSLWLLKPRPLYFTADFF